MRRPRSHDQARAQASRAGSPRHCRGSSSAQTRTSSRSPPCSACSAARIDSYPRSASYGPHLPQWRGVRSMGRVLAKQHRAKWRLPDVFTSPLEDMRVELEAGHTTVVDAVPFPDLFGKTAGRACCMSSGMVSGLPLIIRGDRYPAMYHAFSLHSVSYGRLAHSHDHISARSRPSSEPSPFNSPPLCGRLHRYLCQSESARKTH
jgi:hypothetical protein